MRGEVSGKGRERGEERGDGLQTNKGESPLAPRSTVNRPISERSARAPRKLEKGTVLFGLVKETSLKVATRKILNASRRMSGLDRFFGRGRDAEKWVTTTPSRNLQRVFDP